MDVKEFYPSQFGAFESPFSRSRNESSFDPNNPNPDGDENNTEYEEEDRNGATECELPKYRQLVKAKKEALKNQYGKGHFIYKDCGVKPIHEDLDPTLWNIPCLWDCSKDKNKDKDCCVKNTEKAQKREERRVARWKHDQCTSGANAIGWKSGWRSEWKKFKLDGGLGPLKQQAAGDMGCLNQPSPTPPAITNPSQQMLSSMSCQEMKDRFGIIPGQSWGTAIPEVIKEWQLRQCFVAQPTSSPNATTDGSGEGDVAATENGLINKIINNKGIAITVGAIIVIVLITAVILIPTKKAA